MTAAHSPIRKPALALPNPAEVPLNPRHQQMFDFARATAAGPPELRARLLRECHDVMAYSQVTGRYRVEGLDLAADLRALLVMFAPVPCLPDPAGPLQVAPFARIGFVYPARAARWPTPGTHWAQVITPAHVWLPNVFVNSQVMCLGNTLLPGILATEVLHLVYQALTLQSVQLDLLDAAGVAAPEPARWWAKNLDKIPLTRDGFVRNQEGLAS